MTPTPMKYVQISISLPTRERVHFPRIFVALGERDRKGEAGGRRREVRGTDEEDKRDIEGGLYSLHRFYLAMLYVRRYLSSIFSR